MFKNCRGYTIVEVTLVMGVLGFIVAGAMAMMLGSVSCCDNASTEAYTDSDATIAMQRIVNDVREAKSVTITDGGESLRVIFPVTTTAGYYDRHTPDTANPVDYYVSDSTGVPGRDGTWLWRSRSGARQRIEKDISSVTYQQDTTRSVKITVSARNNAVSGPKQTDLTQRVVYLRNY